MPRTHQDPAPCRRTPRRGARKASLCLLAASVLGLVAASPSWADGPAPDPGTAAFEVDFLTMMIDHHQMAVHMSELCLDRAVHPQLLGLCEDIMTTQAAEIAQMQGWLAHWYGIEHEPSMDHPAHHQGMEHLASLTGEDFEVAFLQMMSEHHAAAVSDGLDCLPEAGHRELRHLCAGIVSSQTREIVRMQVWLCRWYGECDFRDPLAA